MDDRSIIALYFARDEQAIRETAEKYGKLCHGIARNVLGNDQDAEECVNDTYVGLWNAIPPAQPENLSAFVCRVVRNLSLKRLASLSRQKRDRAVTVSLSELEQILPDEQLAKDCGEQRLAELISIFLKGEKEQARLVFIRKYYFFDSVADIAQRYHFSQSKVKSLLYHTRSRLREFLIKENVTI